MKSEDTLTAAEVNAWKEADLTKERESTDLQELSRVLKYIARHKKSNIWGIILQS
jgi:hypothetical protein